jgi:hypothetical protein
MDEDAPIPNGKVNNFSQPQNFNPVCLKDSVVLEYEFLVRSVGDEKIHRYPKQHPVEYLHVKQNGAI